MNDNGRIAVLDIGKSNIKLSICSYSGELCETLEIPNYTSEGTLWKCHNLKKINTWVLKNLSDFSKSYQLERFITSGHGSGVVFVGEDPDINGDGSILPMIDYEQKVPEEIHIAYTKIAGNYFDRGCKIMKTASHNAQQMFWAEKKYPKIFKKTKWVLGISQYWAWRLSGIAVSEVSSLGAQSHLWNVINNDWSETVKNQNWTKLLPPLEKAYKPIGYVRDKLVRDFKLPKNLIVHVGGHDSSINFYRYQSAGLKNFCLVSTGTWIVAMADKSDPNKMQEDLSMSLNADVSGNLVGGAITPGGREYEFIAGKQPKEAMVDIELLSKIIEQETMVIPSFSNYDGQFPNSARNGYIDGPKPINQQERHTLAVLHTALLTVTCADTLGSERDLILDGSYLRDPIFARIVTMLCDNRNTFCDSEIYGVASGGALLCSYGELSESLNLYMPEPIQQISNLSSYAKKWKNKTKQLVKGN